MQPSTSQPGTAASLAARVSQFLFLVTLLLLIGNFAIYVHYAVGLMRFPFSSILGWRTICARNGMAKSDYQTTAGC